MNWFPSFLAFPSNKKKKKKKKKKERKKKHPNRALTTRLYEISVVKYRLLC